MRRAYGGRRSRHGDAQSIPIVPEAVLGQRMRHLCWQDAEDQHLVPQWGPRQWLDLVVHRHACVLLAAWQLR